MYSYVLVFRSRQGCGPLPTVTGYARIEDDLAMLTTSSDAGKVESDSRPYQPALGQRGRGRRGDFEFESFCHEWHKTGKGGTNWARGMSDYGFFKADEEDILDIKRVVLRAYKFIFAL